MQIHGHDKISSNIHPLILSCQLLKLGCRSPASSCRRTTPNSMPRTTTSSCCGRHPHSAGHHTILPQLHTATFVGFTPTLHDDDGLARQRCPAASHRHVLATASHRNRPPAASRRKQSSPRAADLQLTWSPPRHTVAASDRQGSDTNCWRCISQRLFF
jgi:hypothetical protein